MEKDFKHEEEEKDDDSSYELLGCIKILELLDIDVYRQTVDACLRVCRQVQWARTFLSGHFQEARYKLILTVFNAAGQDEDLDVVLVLLSSLTPDAHVRSLLSAVLSALSDKQFYDCFIRTAHKWSGCVLDFCIQDVLSHRRWHLLKRLVLVCYPSQKACEAVLQAAIWSKNWELVNVCVQRTVDVSLRNVALVNAVEYRQWEVVKTCVKAGGNIADACMETKLNLNVKTGRYKHTVLFDAVRDEYSAHSDTLRYYFQAWPDEEKEKCDLETVRLLLQAGADPDVQHGGGTTVFHLAAEHERWWLFSYFLKYSRNAGNVASMQMPQGNSLLHVLCGKGQADIVQSLLAMKADPLVTDAGGNTLMMTALHARDGKENMFRVLIQAGVSTHQAAVSESLLTSQRLRSGEVGENFPSPFWQAVRHGQMRIAKMLYASGACSRGEIHELRQTSEQVMLPPLNSSRLHAHRRQRGHVYIHLRRPTVPGLARDPKIMKFLSEISSKPRSLRDLCALQVSRLIGCGPERPERAARAGLPPSLCRLVLHDHVVSPDFLKDVPPDPEVNMMFTDENILLPYH